MQLICDHYGTSAISLAVCSRGDLHDALDARNCPTRAEIDLVDMKGARRTSER